MNGELFEKLSQLQWLLKKSRFSGVEGDSHMADTTRGQGRILAVLKLRDGISTKELSFLLGLQISSLNELLAKLERGGYIVRQASNQDKRVILARLTEKGANVQQADIQDTDDVFACLTEDEQKTLGSLIDKIISALRANMREEDDGMFSQMEAMRERFKGMSGMPFGDCWNGFHKMFGAGMFGGWCGSKGCCDNE